MSNPIAKLMANMACDDQGQFALLTVSHLQSATAILAVLAAVFWGASAFAPIPDTNLLDQIGKTGAALKRQARLSGIGAMCAALAALLQLCLVYAPTCISLGP